MFSEILKIKPQLDNSDLNKMERTLNARFKRVAKRFGRGIVGVFKAAGGIGLLLGFVNKFLNPLKETQEAINRLLATSDDIGTNAVAFDTSAGKLFKLIKLAQASGLNQNSLFQMLGKFQTGLGRVRQNEKDPLAPVLGEFTNDKDLVDSFYSFLNSIKKLDVKDQAAVKSAVFGEKQSLKVNDLLQQDFIARSKEVGLDRFTSAQLTKANDRVAKLSDYKDAADAFRETKDFLIKSQLVNKKMIDDMNIGAQIKLDRQNLQIRSYSDLQNLSNTSDDMMKKIDEGIIMLGKFIPTITQKINQIVGYLEVFSKSRLVKGIKGWFE